MSLEMSENLGRELERYKRSNKNSRISDEGLEYLTIKEINHVAVSHNHADHAGWLEMYAFQKFYREWRRSVRFKGEKGPLPMLIAEKEVIQDVENSLIHKLESSEAYPGKILGLNDYFRIPELIEDDYISFGEGLGVTIIPADHTVPASGFLLDYEGRKLYYSGDTTFNRNIIEAHADADIIIHECVDTKAGKHTTSDQILTLDKRIRDKVYLYHVPDDKEQEMKDKGLSVLEQYSWMDIGQH